MTEKEFEVQRALGLADEYILTIRTSIVISNQPSVSAQEIKDAVEKHTFTSTLIEETQSGETYPVFNRMLKFDVKCVSEIMQLITVELHPHPIDIEITFLKMRKIIKDGYGWYSRIV